MAARPQIPTASKKARAASGEAESRRPSCPGCTIFNRAAERGRSMRPRAEYLGRGASREPVTGESAEAAQHTAAAGPQQHDPTTRPDNTTAAAGGRRAHRERAPDRGAGEGGQRPTYPRMGASPPPRGNQRREGAARAPGKRRGDRRSVATKGGAGGAGGTTPRGAKRGREGAEPSKRSPPKRRARRRTKERDAGASVASVSPETKDLNGLYITC